MLTSTRTTYNCCLCFLKSVKLCYLMRPATKYTPAWVEVSLNKSENPGTVLYIMRCRLTM